MVDESLAAACGVVSTVMVETVQAWLPPRLVPMAKLTAHLVVATSMASLKGMNLHDALIFGLVVLGSGHLADHTIVAPMRHASKADEASLITKRPPPPPDGGGGEQPGGMT